uniref:Uncharacterized protein n=1 Tax=uncultured marine virus TaxID=186617 RepID=A0A0F7LA46_9VIRU|nr:hypothetical protein [uncultured marine virus]
MHQQSGTLLLDLHDLQISLAWHPPFFSSESMENQISLLYLDWYMLTILNDVILCQMPLLIRWLV